MAMLAHGLDREAGGLGGDQTGGSGRHPHHGGGAGPAGGGAGRGATEDWFGSSFIVRLTVISVVALVFFVISQLLRRHPWSTCGCCTPRFALACFAYLVLGMALMGSIYVLPLYMTQIHKLQRLEDGEVLMWMGLPQLLVLPLVPRLVTRIDPRYLVSFGFLVFCHQLLS